MDMNKDVDDVVTMIMRPQALDAVKLRNHLKELKETVNKPMVLVVPGGKYIEEHSKL